MAGSYDMVALDLDTQIQLLSRIQFVTRFSSNFVQVTGEIGAGKTWLSERYLEKWACEPIQSLLICNTNQQDAQRRAIILRQIVRDSVFNEQDPIVQSLDYMLDGRSVHALIVIDDAQRLSANIVAELWALITEAQVRENWQINVLLFSLRGKLNKWLHKVSYGQGIKPLELEINPLSENERDMFIDVLIADQQMDAASRRALRQKAVLLPLLPGQLKELGTLEALSMDDKKSHSYVVMIVLTIALLAVGSALIWFAFQPGHPPAQPITMLPNSVEALSKIENKLTSEQAVNDNQLVEKAKDAMVVDDTIELSPNVVVEGMTVGRNDQNKREVVVPDNVVDAMMDEQNTEEITKNITPSSSTIKKSPDNADETISTKAAFDIKMPIEDKTDNKKAVIIQSKPTITQSKPTLEKIPAMVEVPLVNQVLLTVPASHYGLQFAALKSKQAVAEFIQAYGLQNKVMVYETTRKGSPWFMVLFGNYLSLNEAREALLQLPEKLRNLSPWPKSFSKIHEEIKLIK